jgi:vitamin B12 transporter
MSFRSVDHAPAKRSLPVRCAALTAIATLALATLSRAVSAQPPAARPEQIVVTASIVPTELRQVGAAVSVLPGDEIELRGYHGLADALRTQPGIAVSNAGGSGKQTVVRIRGEEHYRTLLMIDGVKALDTSAPQVAPSFDSLLTTSDLERVEVLRGPQGFIYGADAGGVVNVLSKRGAGGLGGRIGLEYGEHSTRKIGLAVSGGGEQGDYFVSATDLATDGFNAQSADTVLRDDDGDDNSTLHAKFGWNASESLRLQLVARDIDADTAYDGCFSPATFATVHDCRGTTQQKTYKVSAEHTAGALSNTFGYSNVDVVRDNFAGEQSAFATEGNLNRIEYTGSYRPSASAALVYGLDLQDEGLVDADGPRSRDQRGVYVEYQGALDDTLFVSLGARYDDNDDFGSHTSSRLSVAYVTDLGSGSSWKYRASVGTGFRAPSLYELAYNAGPFAFPPAAGLALAEETSRGFDLGLEYDAANGLHFELTYFDQDIEDEIFFDLASFAGYLQSTGKSKSKGVELAAVVPLGERWRLLANWTRNDAASSANEQRLRRPKNIGNIGLSYRGAGERFSFIAHYRLARDSIDIGGVALDDYAVLDLAGSYAFGGGLELFGRIENAADEVYQELVGHNTAGRAAYGGLRLNF